MHKFLIFVLRFLIGEGNGHLRRQAFRVCEAAPCQKAPEEGWRTPRRWRERSMFPSKYLIFRRLSPFFMFFHRFFTPFFRCKRLVFRRLQKIPGDKRRRERKIKSENGKRPGFIGESGRHEVMASEIFHAKGARSSRVVRAGPALSQVRFLTQRRKGAEAQRIIGEGCPDDNDGYRRVSTHNIFLRCKAGARLGGRDMEVSWHAGISGFRGLDDYNGNRWRSRSSNG